MSAPVVPTPEVDCSVRGDVVVVPPIWSGVVKLVVTDTAAGKLSVQVPVLVIVQVPDAVI